jgi:amino acid transporter
MDVSGVSLKKTMTLKDLVFFGLASILGSGGFNLIGEAVMKGGNWWPLALAISSAIFLGASKTYEEAFTAFKNNTAESDFVKKIFGEEASIVSISAILMWNLLSISVILVICAHMLFPDAGWTFQISFALLLLGMMSLFSLKGLDVNKEIINYFSMALIAILSLVTVIGGVGVVQKGIVPVPPIADQSFTASLLFFFFILAGFDALIKFTEETIDEKDVPRSFYISNGISIVMVLGLCLAFTSWVNMRKVKFYDNGLGDIAQVFLGGGAKTYTAWIAVIYMIITTFVTFLATTRYIYSLAELYPWLAPLKFVNSAKAPSLSIFLTTISSALGILMNNIEYLVRLSDFGLSSLLVMVAAAATKSQVLEGNVPVVEGLTTVSLLGLLGISFV